MDVDVFSAHMHNTRKGSIILFIKRNKSHMRTAMTGGDAMMTYNMLKEKKEIQPTE